MAIGEEGRKNATVVRGRCVIVATTYAQNSFHPIFPLLFQSPFQALFAVAALRAPSIVFIDEIDSLLTSRSDGEHESR